MLEQQKFINDLEKASLTKKFGELTITGFWVYNEDTIAVNCITGE